MMRKTFLESSHWSKSQKQRLKHTHMTHHAHTRMITYHVASSGPLPKMFHFFNKVITSDISENWEPVHIRTRLRTEDTAQLNRTVTSFISQDTSKDSKDESRNSKKSTVRGRLNLNTLTKIFF